MSGPSREVDPRVDLYIDGLLSGEELAAFERELGESESLRGQLQAQDRIDAELQNLYAYDAAKAAAPIAAPRVQGESVIGRVDGRSPEPSPPTRRTVPVAPLSGSLLRLRWYGVAAAVCLAAAGLWATYIHLATPSLDKVLGPAEVYAMVDKPEFVCKTDAEFAAAVEERLGQPLVLAATPGIEALGWAYGDDYNGKIVGADTMVLINRVQDQKVLVFMDRRRDDRRIEIAPGSGLSLHRREIGSLVVYEVTPLPRAEVIDRLYDPVTGTPPDP